MILIFFIVNWFFFSKLEMVGIGLMLGKLELIFIVILFLNNKLCLKFNLYVIFFFIISNKIVLLFFI